MKFLKSFNALSGFIAFSGIIIIVVFQISNSSQKPVSSSPTSKESKIIKEYFDGYPLKTYNCIEASISNKFKLENMDLAI